MKWVERRLGMNIKRIKTAYNSAQAQPEKGMRLCAERYVKVIGNVRKNHCRINVHSKTEIKIFLNNDIRRN